MPRRSLSAALRRAQYGAAQAARIAWYAGHYAVGRRVMGPIGEDDDRPRITMRERRRLAAAFRALFEDDWRSIEAGEYKAPASLGRPPSLIAALSSSRDYLRDAREVARRRRRHGHSEMPGDASRERFPRYYLQNFHYQSDGWLSAASAARYDMQVETLFTGAADAMRRRALPAIGRALARRDLATASLVDLACGTGAFLAAVKDNWPDLDVTALDLSPAYLGRARTVLAGREGVAFREAAAEATGFADARFDVATSVYLFHELPPAVRAQTAREIARILKPGGVYVHADTLQYGDDDALDALLAAFPRAVHEPYYDSYCRADLGALFAEAGLERAEPDALAFLTKISVFRRPA